MAKPCPIVGKSLFDNRDEGPIKALKAIQPPNTLLRGARLRPCHLFASHQSPALVKMGPLNPQSTAELRRLGVARIDTRLGPREPVGTYDVIHVSRATE